MGETDRPLIERIKEHIGYAKKQIVNKTTGNHFNLPGHSWVNMKFTVIEQVKTTDKHTERKDRNISLNCSIHTMMA